MTGILGGGWVAGVDGASIAVLMTKPYEARFKNVAFQDAGINTLGS